MKAVFVTLGIVAVVGVALLVVVLFRVAGAVRTAHGQTLYSSVGSWRRIQEFAHAQGKTNYIAEADRTLALLERDLKAWRDSAPAGTDFGALEKMEEFANKTTDAKIKNGQNPLGYLDSAANPQQESNTAQASSQKASGMSGFEYLACDGGPHLVLPKELSGQWKGGGGSVLAAINPLSDYRRACAAVTNQHMALISVGNGQAMVLAGPPMSAWGRSPEGWIDIYYLEAWQDTNVDAMVKRAVAATPTSAMSDTGKVMTLTKPGLILLFAGDTPGSSAYGEFAIPIKAGSYQILEGHYKGRNWEEGYVYRMRPKGE
jgi:hypothetical protein